MKIIAIGTSMNNCYKLSQIKSNIVSTSLQIHLSISYHQHFVKNCIYM